MKIFAVRDETAETRKDLAYLFYYETEKCFYIELPENADPWETPLLLDSFARQGVKTVDTCRSRLWVQQRIVPADRQNLGQILRDNGLKEYDEFELLTLAMGRCAQDDYFLVPINWDDLPAEIQDRFRTRIDDLLPLDSFCLLVFFRDGAVKKCSLKACFEQDAAFAPLLRKPEAFFAVRMLTGGYGASWDIRMTVSDSTLYRIGETVPLTAADFRNFAVQRVVNAAEAAEILNCSRQNIQDLAKRNKLHPIKTSERNTLYLKSEVLRRSWQ